MNMEKLVRMDGTGSISIRFRNADIRNAYATSGSSVLKVYLNIRIRNMKMY